MLAQQLVNGLFLGAVYALFAVGYTLVFGVLDILNLAHAAIFMIAAFAAYSLVAAGLPIAVGVRRRRAARGRGRHPARPGRVRTAAPPQRRNARAADLIDRGRDHHRRDRARDLRHRRAALRSGRDRRAADSPRRGNLHRSRGHHLRHRDRLDARAELRAARTTLGRSIRAVSQDRIAAALLGVDIERTIAATFFIASALGGAAGILTGLEYNSVSIDMATSIELKGLAVIILGGMGSITGAVIGGFVIGAVETLAIAFGLSAWRDALTFGVMFVILVARPAGIFGARALAQRMTFVVEFYAHHSRLLDQIGINALLALSLSVSLQAGPTGARAGRPGRHRRLRLSDREHAIPLAAGGEHRAGRRVFDARRGTARLPGAQAARHLSRHRDHRLRRDRARHRQQPQDHGRRRGLERHPQRREYGG